MGALLSSISPDSDQAKNNGTNYEYVINKTIPLNSSESVIPESLDSNLSDLTNRQLSNNTGSFYPNSNDSEKNEDFSFSLFGYDVKPYQWLATVSPWAGPASAVAMIVCCVIPYVPQYWTIHKTHNSSGFSTLVCLALLIANITRIAFWFGKTFDTALLVQSGVMIIAQIMLLEICVRVKRETNAINNSIQLRNEDNKSYENDILENELGFVRTKCEKTLFRSNPKYFWAWTDLSSYIEFLLIFSVVVGTSMYYFRRDIVFVETMGFFSLMTESMLAMPQLIQNFRKRSVVGLSYLMVLAWLAGDTFKLGYFIVKDQPTQFMVCGITQITIDVLILIQIVVFSRKSSKNNGRYKKSNVRT